MKKNEPIKHIMTTTPVTVHTKQNPSEVRALLAEGKFHHVPVVSGEKLVGMISSTDLMRVSFNNYMGDARAEAGVEHGARGGLVRGIAELHGAKGKAAGRGSVGGGDLHGHGAEIAMWMLQRKAVTLKVESHGLRRGETEANPNPSQGAHAHENA